MRLKIYFSFAFPHPSSSFLFARKILPGEDSRTIQIRLGADEWSMPGEANTLPWGSKCNSISLLSLTLCSPESLFCHFLGSRSDPHPFSGGGSSESISLSFTAHHLPRQGKTNQKLTMPFSHEIFFRYSSCNRTTCLTASISNLSSNPFHPTLSPRLGAWCPADLQLISTPFLRFILRRSLSLSSIIFNPTHVLFSRGAVLMQAGYLEHP